MHTYVFCLSLTMMHTNDIWSKTLRYKWCIFDKSLVGIQLMFINIPSYSAYALIDLPLSPLLSSSFDLIQVDIPVKYLGFFLDDDAEYEHIRKVSYLSTYFWCLHQCLFIFLISVFCPCIVLGIWGRTYADRWCEETAYWSLNSVGRKASKSSCCCDGWGNRFMPFHRRL